ncbi:DUF4175 family protein [Gimesia aquarii]|uniref:Uncharacterized protein n=1 Tax=Gimesia aquarii TaxID=2527964 RepID=A0A517X2R6_9PLAN|nr:DUF4175 family protein [Gimesia aquarii]QDU11785.1 hypothetical protein V202x_52090 [Gimesia aquarii]
MDGQLTLFVNELKRQLNQLDRRIRSLALLRGLGLVILVLICLITLQISLDFLFSLGTTARVVLSSLSLTVLVGCIWFAMLRRVFHKRTPVELAAIVEESQSTLNERLTSVLELSSVQNESSSILMREHLAKETIASLTTFNITDSVPSDRAMRFIMSAGIAILLFLTPLLVWPDAYKLLLSRSVIPWGNFATVSSLYFEVQPGDETVARGKDLQILATPHWHTKQPETIKEVWIEWEDSQGEPFSRRMDLNETTGQYTTQFPRLLSGFQYIITTERSRSKRYTIQISEPPSITDTLLTIMPPGYTHKKPQEFTVLPSEISVPEQSQFKINLTFDRAVKDAKLQYQYYLAGSDNQQRPPVEHQKFVLSEDRLSAQLELPVHKKSFVFHIEFKSEKGNLTTKTSEHLVKVIPDHAPEIEISLYNQSEFFKPDEILSVPVKVIDDYSVKELEVHVQKLDEKPILIKVPAEQLGTKSVSHEFKIDLKEIKAKQADIFTYRVRAADNREVPSPNVVWSTPRVFGIDKNAEEQLSAGVIARQQKLRDELRKIQEDFKKHQKAVDQKIANLKQPKEKGKLKGEDQQELQELSKEERKIAQRLEALANDFLQLPLYQKLAEQTQEVARHDFVKHHDTLKSAADKETIEQARKELSSTPKAMSATDKKLDELAQQYEKLVELENDLLNLNRLAEETDHLANDLLAFNDKVESATQQPDTKANENQKTPNSQEKQHAEKQKLSPEIEQDLANFQNELKHRQSRLSEELNNLLKRRPELVDAARNFQLKQLDSLVNQTSQLVEPQRQLAQAIEQQAPLAASKPDTNEPQNQSAAQDVKNKDSENQPQTASTPGNETAKGPEIQTAAAGPGDSEPVKTAQATEPQMSPTNTPAAQNLSESVLDLQKQQQDLAAAATNFVLEAAQEFGPQSEPTRKATQLAEESIKAQKEANAGRLHEASQAANRAAKIAEEIMSAHEAQNKDQTERDAFKEQTEKLVNMQQELAGKLEEASTSEALRQEALKNSQQALAQQTKALSQQLAETSQKLNTNPIGLKKEGKQAERTQEKTAKAEQQMQKAVEDLSKEDLKRASQQAQQAARTLQEAAQQAQKSRPQRQAETPVPEKVGNQVTDAAMQLRNAQKQLEQTPEFKAGDQTLAQKSQAKSGESNSKSNQTQSSQQEDSQAREQNKLEDTKRGKDAQSSKEQVAQNSKSQSQQSKSGKPSQSSSSKKAAEALKRAAESLSQAATELKSKAQQGSNPGKGQESQTASKNMASGKGQGQSEGGGAINSVDFSQLKTKLKAMSSRNWGELPGNLDTEILQGSRSKTDPEYARLIKHYFEAIAKSKSDNN